MSGGSAVRDFVVNILGDTSNVDKAFELFQENAGKAAAGAAAAFVGHQIGNALAANLDADQVNRELSASLGATPEQAARYGAAAAGLYRDAWGESMGEVSDAVEAVTSSMSGMRDAAQEDLERISSRAMDTARAFDMGVGEAATAAGLLMQTGLAANADEAFDLIVAGLQRVPVELRGEVMDATREYSQYFAQLGLDGEQAMGALVAASANGQYAIDKTGDALKELTIRGTDMSVASQEAYAAAGLSAQQMSQALLAGGDQGAQALGQIVDGLLSMEDPTAQATAAIALFGTPLEDIGTDKIPEFLTALQSASGGLEDVDGAAEAMSATLNGSPATTVEEWRRRAQGFAQDLVDLPGPLGDVALGVQAFGGDTLNLAGSIGSAVIAIRGMNLAKAAASVASGIATAAQWAWNAAISANPIGLIILAIAALVAGIVLLVQNWDTVKAAGADAWAWILDAWSGAGDFFGDLGDSIRNAFRGAFNAVAGLWNDSLGAIELNVPNWVPGIGGRKFEVPDIPLLAAGGTIMSAGWGIVGDAGPELLRLPVGAQVIPLSGADRSADPGRASAGPGNLYGGGVSIGTLNTGADPQDIFDEIEWRARQG